MNRPNATRAASRLWLGIAMAGLWSLSGPCLSPGSESAPGGVVRLAPDDPLRVGVSTVLSGEDVSLGLALLQGAEAFVQDRPVLLGHPLELIPVDDRCDGSTTLEQAKRWCGLTPRPAAVVGYMCTPGTEAALQIHGECRIPLINVTSGSPGLGRSGSPWVVRLWTSKDRQALLVAAWARTKGFRRLLVIHEEDSASLVTLEVLQDAVSRISPRPRLQAASLMGAQINGRAFFPEKEMPQLVVYLGEGWDLSDLWRDLPSSARAVPWVLDERVDYLSSDADGAPRPKELHRVSLRLPTGELASPQTQYYRGRFGEPGVYTLAVYDALSALAQGLERCAKKSGEGTSWDPRDLVKAMKEVKIHGLTGLVSFDEWGERIPARGSVQRWKDGRWEILWEGQVP
jgi:ABC-type branched-subunit amino acid transport system substrate-binding protein